MSLAEADAWAAALRARSKRGVFSAASNCQSYLAAKPAQAGDRRGGRFLLTGSVDVMRLPRLSDSLAGRMEVITLHPFSQGELRGRRDAFVDWAFSGKPPPDAAWEHTSGDPPRFTRWTAASPPI